MLLPGSHSAYPRTFLVNSEVQGLSIYLALDCRVTKAALIISILDQRAIALRARLSDAGETEYLEVALALHQAPQVVVRSLPKSLIEGGEYCLQVRIFAATQAIKSTTADIADKRPNLLARIHTARAGAGRESLSR